jgi:hypothetical protein
MVQQKNQCALRFVKFELVIRVRHEFRRVYRASLLGNKLDSGTTTLGGLVVLIRSQDDLVHWKRMLSIYTIILCGVPKNL